MFDLNKIPVTYEDGGFVLHDMTRCKDGTEFSIQRSAIHSCDDNSYEILAYNHDGRHFMLMIPYSDMSNHYIYVPQNVVDELIAIHGGLAN